MEEYYLVNNYIYEYNEIESEEFLFNDIIDLKNYKIDKKALIFLSNHYSKLYLKSSDNIFSLSLDVNIDGIKCTVSFTYIKNTAIRAFFTINTVYCNINKQLLSFELTHNTLKIENMLYNLFYHYNFVINNFKYSNYLNILYYKNIDYNTTFIEYKNKLLYNIDTETDNECCICYSKTLLKTPKCNHSLCYMCFSKLIKKCCPTCRTCFCNSENDEDDYDHSDYEHTY